MTINTAYKIAIEGPDLAGKSTLIDGLKTTLERRNLKVKVVHFPRYERPIGSLIKEILTSDKKLDPYALQSLYSAEMYDFCNNELKALEKEYDIILYDRFYYSTIVYSKVLGLSYEKMFILSKDISKPDLLININSDISVFINRLLKRNEEADKFESNHKFMSKIINEYNELESTLLFLNDYGKSNTFRFANYNEIIKNISTDQDPRDILNQALVFINDNMNTKLEVS